MLSRRTLLTSGLGALGLGALGVPAIGKAGGKRLIVVVASGGWDTSFALDPKLDVPSFEGPEVDQRLVIPTDRESIETFSGIPIATNPLRRPAVTSFFKKFGGRTVVVNGIWTGVISHPGALTRILTGTGDRLRPDLAAITGHEATAALGYIDLGGLGFFGELAASSGRVGIQRQVKALLDPATHFTAPEGADFSYPTFRPQESDLEMLEAWTASRAERFRESHDAMVGTDEAVDDYLISRSRAASLRALGPGLVEGLTWGGQVSFLGDCKLAVDLLEADACRSVMLSTRQQWDTHAENTKQHRSWNQTFFGLYALVSALQEREMLDDTVVLVVSEISRTPRLNADLGKDHWPHTSAMVIGGGLKGGRVLGGTNDYLQSQPVDLASGDRYDGGDLIRYDNLVAAVLNEVGVDAGRWLPGVIPLGGI